MYSGLTDYGTPHPLPPMHDLKAKSLVIRACFFYPGVSEEKRVISWWVGGEKALYSPDVDWKQDRSKPFWSLEADL